MKVVILPGRVLGAPSSLIVYLLRQEEKPHEVALGMHYRVFVSGDGSVLEKVEPLTNWPSRSEASPHAIAWDGNFVLGYPPETFVLQSLSHGDMVMWVTSRRIHWFVIGDVIGVHLQAEPSFSEVASLVNAARTRLAKAGISESDVPTLSLNSIWGE